MASKIVILILILLILLVLIFFLVMNRTKDNLSNQNETYFDTVFDIPTIRKQQEETSQELFGTKLETCKSIPITNSQGLILDSAIVCHVTRDLTHQPIFYYEIYPENCIQDSYFFVNLDYTDFQKLLYDSKSPKNILCKTLQTYNILKNYFPHKNVIYTGFTSIDRLLPKSDKNYNSFIHIAGKSPNKGTTRLIQTWLNHPEWPVITIICREDVLKSIQHSISTIKNTKNINLIDKFLPEKKLVEYMNHNGVHICTSEFEGFGHYINEARSTEAVVLYTNGEPMNEMFTDGVDGIAISSIRDKPTNQGICPTYLVSPQSIEAAVNKTLTLSEAERKEMGKKTRIRFLENDKKFRDTLLSLFK